MVPTSTGEFLHGAIASRLEPRGRDWLEATAAEIAAGVANARFASLLSLASRHAGRGPLAPDPGELARAAELLEGWNPERWSRLDALRVRLVLARSDLAEPSAELAVEEAFRYADEGELCALYRALPLLPEPARFAWRAGEGCRTNMQTVFEAVACDNPYPAWHFDDVAWRQAVVKCLFIGSPLWRIWGLDGRLSPELARMALDLADERRSAHRPVQHELWLALGPHGGQRGTESIERELAGSHTLGRRAAAYALARAGELARLEEHAAREGDPEVAAAMRDALSGNTGQAVFRSLDPSLCRA